MSRSEFDVIEAEGNHFTRGAMQLSSQLQAHRAGADNRYVDLTGPYRPLLRIRSNARIDEAPMEARCLGRCLQWRFMLGNARRSKIIDHAADRDD